MSVSKIIANRDHTIVSCTPGDTVLLAAKLLADKRIGALPVLDGDGIAGIFSERDLLYCVAREGAEVLSRPVGEVMTSPAITIEADTSVLKALSLMTRRRIRHLPVMEGEKMIGFLSIGDLVKYRMEMIEAEAEQMREYITHA
ncbi:CBS domain-containing protein [Aurantiacibacter poecillastricola]|uniref:CBS domain-containing protein n=1 Tax=Aurantiacibacter poecillastricola TaxID=3064385 RepID=UPI00273E3E2A|nr:CBS domain-containing protein [Aurantiacibacter sp. 219JJ12-13]MDP5260519.1 CBS domain-containing protein [Aurantiacibacter sp. 219JJ12-13]